MKLSVSFQFGPQEKIPVGTLSDFGRDTVFEYDASFLARGINPAPFRPGVQVYDRQKRSDCDDDNESSGDSPRGFLKGR